MRPNGIAGLEGREPVGAALTIGVKGPSGAPVEKDRFHIVMPTADANDRREHHPAFAPFNNAPVDRRKAITCNLLHATRDDAFRFYLRAQTVKGAPSHPSKVPFCVGDGATATRYQGARDGQHQFAQIPCPHDRCQYRLGDRPECKPWMQLLFRPQWAPGAVLPAPLMKFTSQSWNTIRNFVGMFDQLDAQARAFGLSDYSLLGFAFTMTLTERKNAERKSRFPVVAVAPATDPVAFFMGQLDRRDRIASTPGVAGLPAPMPVSLREQPVEVEDADFAAHVPGRSGGAA